MAEAMLRQREKSRNNNHFKRKKSFNAHSNQRSYRETFNEAQMDQIASNVRVIKRELNVMIDELPNSNPNSRRRETIRMSTALPSGYRSSTRAIMDDLREIQESLASLQIGIARLNVECARARVPPPPPVYYNQY